MMKITQLASILKLGDHNFGRLVQNFCFSHDVNTATIDNESHQYHENENFNESALKRGIPLSIDEYKVRKTLKPCQPANPHLLKVAILGEPNVGKSTLTNRLMRWKVCPVSKKVHTTRTKAAAIFVEDNKQIVFLDTPGFVTPEHSIKHHLEVSLVADPERSVRDADLIAVVVDAACKWTSNRIHEDILTMLNNCKSKKSILVLNKVDIQKQKNRILKISNILTRGVIDGVPAAPCTQETKKKEKLTLEELFKRTEKLIAKEEKARRKAEAPLEHVEGAKGWPFFSKIFMVSALQGDGVDDLRNYLLDSALPGEWLYHYSNVIDKNPHDLAVATVREKLLDELPEEIPYSLNLRIKSWEVDFAGCLRISIGIQCPKPRYKQIVIGNSGQRIAKCVEESRQALQDMFRSEIFLKLAVE